MQLLFLLQPKDSLEQRTFVGMEVGLLLIVAVMAKV